MISRRFWGTVFSLVIASAVFIQLARQAFPLLTDYKEELSAYLGNSVGMDLEIALVDASWSGLKPKLELKGVHVKAKTGESVFIVSQATAELSIIDSIIDRRLAWRQLKFDGFKMALVQDEHGAWSVPGMPEFTRSSNDSNALRFDDIYDIFLFGRRVHITDARFQLKYFSREASQLHIPNISLENDEDFHRILASLDVGKGERAFYLAIEGLGDPRDSNFTANGYLELKNFPSHEVAAALALSSIKSEEYTLNLRLWFQGDANKGISLRGDLEAAGDVNIVDREFNLPKALSAQLAGQLDQEKNWHLTVKGFNAQWPEFQSPVLDFIAKGNLQRLNNIRVQSIDVKPWVDTLLHIGFGNERTNKIVKTINPRGTVKNLDFEITTKEEGYFQISALVEDGMSEAIMGAPALSNINGFVSMNLHRGRFDVDVDDGFTLFLPKVYHDPMDFAEAHGQVGWEIDFKNRITYITSGLLTVTNPEEEGKGYLKLTLPFSKKWGTQQMTLVLGIEKTLAENHKKYVPKTVPKSLYDWLDGSIKSGKISNARFLYHGSVEKKPPVPPTIQLYGEVNDGNLIFDPKWPELKGVDGSLNLDNNSLSMNISKAKLLGNSISNTHVSLIKDSSVKNGQALSIQGRVKSDANTAMKLLYDTPIRQNIGNAFDRWIVDGKVGAKVDLVVPLSSGSSNLSQKVDVSLNNSYLQIPEVNLEIKKINGVLHYQTDKGVFADKLSGKVWGKSFKSRISSPPNAEGGLDTRVSFDGMVDVDALYAWVTRPELIFLEGETEVQGHITVPGAKSARPLEVNVSSDLNGVAINLPRPLKKLDQEAINFTGRALFFDDKEEYRFSLNNDLRISLLTTKQGNATSDTVASDSISGLVEINELTPRDNSYTTIPSTGRFDIVGSLTQFDLEKWTSVKDTYFHFIENPDSEFDVDPDANSDDLQAKFDLSIDKFLLGSFTIDNLSVTGERKQPLWEMQLSSELLAGTVVVSEEDQPIVLDLDYLRFVKDDEAETNATNSPSDIALDTVGKEKIDGSETTLEPPYESVLAEVDLSEAVAIDFSTKELSINGENYGTWDFQVDPIDGGVVFSDIRAEVREMRVGTEEAGAEFVWMSDGEQNNSYFSGKVLAKNLADVFAAWEQEKLMESDSAVFDIDARWKGAPDEVTLNNVKGLLSLDVKKGSFSRGAGSDENALLRLIALFNFDTILRRLRLDFSDLAAQGFSYDRVFGSLDFKNGKIFLTEPLIVESSSSYIQLAGTIDMANEKLDSELVVTLPVASNVALATAVVVGLPAALGVYAMSKLFKKQVDRASSFNVEVTGDWEQPKINIKKIFDINAANRRGKEIKEQDLDTIAVP